MYSRIAATSASDRSLIRISGLTFVCARISRARVGPIPYKEVRPTSTRLLRGRSTPSILAIVQLSLSLFMLWIFADNIHSAFAPHDSAFGAALPYRRRNFHGHTPYKLPFSI